MIPELGDGDIGCGGLEVKKEESRIRILIFDCERYLANALRSSAESEALLVEFFEPWEDDFAEFALDSMQSFVALEV